MNLILLIVIFLYAAILLCFCIGFVLQRYHESPVKEYPFVSIIIAARNEEKNILTCLRSIYAQNYDGDFQIILVDDASNDRTFQLAKEYLETSGLSHRILRNEKPLGKKRSLQKAVEQSSASILVSRDADTYTTNPEWLKNMVNRLIDSRSEMVIGPVGIHTGNLVISLFEWLENGVLTIVSGGSSYYHRPFLASGANLVFTRAAYNEVGGYSSHIHIPSGDDVFLLRDLKKAGKKVSYLKSHTSVVTTYPASGISGLLSQKIRWSSKIFQGSGPGSLLLAAIIFAANLLWIFSLFMLFLKPGNPVHLTVLLVKFLTDTIIVILAASFFRKLKLAWLIFPMAIVYPFYSLLVAAGTLLIKPRWK